MWHHLSIRLLWTVILVLRLVFLPVEFKFFTNWAWIIQAAVFTLSALPSRCAVRGVCWDPRSLAARFLPCAYSLAWVVFVGVTAIAFRNPGVLLVPNAAEGIVVDHIMHCLTLTLVTAFAPDIALGGYASDVEAWRWRVGPPVITMVLFRLLYDPNLIYLQVPVPEITWWVGALVTVILADFMFVHTVVGLLAAAVPHPDVPGVPAAVAEVVHRGESWRSKYNRSKAGSSTGSFSTIV